MKRKKMVSILLGAAVLGACGICNSRGVEVDKAGEWGSQQRIFLREETAKAAGFLGDMPESVKNTEDKTSASEGVENIYNNIYPIGSVSKTFGAAAVLKLVDEGKIDLERPVVDYLPEFRLKDPRYKEITVRMLLSHSSGLMGNVAGGLVIGENDSEYHDTYLDVLSGQTLKADPGEYSVYCNSGFMVAELLVERVSGMEYSEYLQKEISIPLGLHSTGSIKTGPDSSEYVPARINGRSIPFINCQDIADGGMLSTTDDLCRFGQIFMEGNDFLTEPSKKIMIENWSARDGFGYIDGDSMFRFGLGLDGVGIYPYNRYGLSAITKSGNVGSFQTNFTVLPEQKLSVAVTGQGGQADESSLMAQDIILSVLKEEGLISDTEIAMEEIKKELYGTRTEEVIPVPDEIKAYAGSYGNTGLYEISFPQEGGMCIKTMGTSRKQRMDFSYLGNGKFAPVNGGFIGIMGELTSDSAKGEGCSLVWFKEEKNGRVYLEGQRYEEKTGLGTGAVCGAIAQKLMECEAGKEAEEAWKKREDSIYYLSSAKYNDLGYLSYPMGRLHVDEGYVTLHTLSDHIAKGPAVILDAEHCDSNVDVPLMVSRDLVNYEIYQKNGVEYLTGEGRSLDTFCSESGLFHSSDLNGTYQLTGEPMADWFYIDPEDEGKMTEITPSEKASCFVYDKNGECVYSTLYQDAGNKVILPKKGYLVLVGGKGESVDVKK